MTVVWLIEQRSGVSLEHDGGEVCDDPSGSTERGA
jgi:hypothetical protein